MNNFGASLVTIIGLFVTVAIVSVVLSNKASTSSVIKSAGDAISSILKAAVSPVAS